MWAFLCGVVSARGDVTQWRVVIGLLVAGPCVCAASQMVNDWFDRDVDAKGQDSGPVENNDVGMDEAA